MGFVGFLAVMGWKRSHLLPPQFGMNVLKRRVYGPVRTLGLDRHRQRRACGGAMAGALVGCWHFRTGTPVFHYRNPLGK